MTFEGPRRSPPIPDVALAMSYAESFGHVVGLDRLTGWWITADDQIERIVVVRHPIGGTRLMILWDDKIRSLARCNFQFQVLETVIEGIKFFAEWFDEPGCESGAVEKLFWTDNDIWMRPCPARLDNILAAEAAEAAATKAATLRKTPWLECDGIYPEWAKKPRTARRDVAAKPITGVARGSVVGEVDANKQGVARGSGAVDLAANKKRGGTRKCGD